MNLNEPYAAGTLNVLLLENNPREIERIRQILAGSFACSVHLDTAEDVARFADLAQRGRYDAILAGTEEALDAALSICPHTPFVCVSEAVGEERAVDLIQKGAADFVLKGYLERLPAAISRARALAARRAEKDRAEQKTRKTLEGFEEAQRIAKTGSWVWDLKADEKYYTKEVYRILSMEPRSETADNLLIRRHIAPEDKARVMQALHRTLCFCEPFDQTFKIVCDDGSQKTIRSRINARGDNCLAAYMTGTLQDITDRRQAEEEHKRQADLEQNMLLFAQNLMNISDDCPGGALNHALKMSAEFCGMDGAALWEYDWANRLAVCKGMWATTGRNKHSPIPLEVLVNGLDRHREGLPYEISHLEEGAWPLEFAKMGIRSLVGFPLMRQEQLFGTLILTARRPIRFSDLEKSAISMTCGTLLNMIIREEKEEELRELDARNRQVLDSMAEGIMMVDQQGIVLNVNAAFLKRLGNVNIVGMHLSEVFCEEKYGKLFVNRYANLQRVLGKGEPLVFEDSWNGRWFKNRFYPVFKDGQVSAVTFFSADITDSKRAAGEARRNDELLKEAEFLRRKEQEYLQILDGSSETSYIYDFQAKTLVFPPEWCKRIGAEAVPAQKMIKYAQHLIHPDDLQRVLREKVRAVKERRPKFRCEYRFKTAGDQSIWLLDQGKLVYDGSGNVLKIYGALMDVTERMNAQEALRNSLGLIEYQKECMGLLYESAGMILSSRAPREDINRLCSRVMEFLGCDSFSNFLVVEDQPMLRLNASAGIPPETEETILLVPYGSAICGCVARDRTSIVVEDIQKNDDPRVALVRHTGMRAYAGFPILSGGKAMGTISFGTTKKDAFGDSELSLMKAVAEHAAVALRRADMEKTLRSQAEELKKQNGLITDFFINISHEFKTPISILLLALDMAEILIRQRSIDRRKMESHIKIMRQNCNRLSRLVGNLLDITKLDAGFMTPDWMTADIVRLLRNLCKSIGIYASLKSISLKFSSDVKSKKMPVDEQFIERIILNLVSNALKYTPRNGQIDMRLEAYADKVIISVKDNGEGIPEDKQEAIFDRFRQVNNSLSRSSEGCGIGLSLAKSMAEMLRGRIWCESVPGGGSVFFVELPVLPQAESPQRENMLMTQLQSRINLEFSDISFD